MYSMHIRVIIRTGLIAAWLLLLGFNRAQADDSAAVRVINAAGSGKVEMKLRNVSDNQLAPGGLITWSNVKAGQTAWKLAGQYIEISHQDLPAFWGMQIYTDNKNDSANPKYTGTADPAGLVKTDKTLIALPMAWRITDSLLSGEDLKDPQERSDRKGFEDYLWHYLKDKNTPDKPDTDLDERFANGSEYVTLWNQAGIAWNEGGRTGNPKKAYLYLAAKFTMASVDSEYKTTTLTLEAFQGLSPFPIYLYQDAPLTEWPEEKGATLANHFAPSGWLNYSPTRKIITVNSKSKEVEPHSGAHCFKINWNGDAGQDGYKWAGVMWLEPEDIWQKSGKSSTHNGYDLRGADYLSFWARTDKKNQGLELKTYFGNSWDSCGQSAAIWRTPALTMEWQQYIIPILNKDMSNVTGALAVIFNDEHDPDPDGCTIYLDDIKFDKF